MRRHVALFSAAALAAGVTVTVPVALAAKGGHKPAIYLVGGGVESINPSQPMLDERDFFLGGYGFGSGRLANKVEVPEGSDALGNRFATGILGDGAHTRAFFVSDGTSSIVLAQIETQGFFSAYKQGPFGLNEIRQDAAARIAELREQDGGAPAPTASQIVADSNHSHGGADTAGVWGGVPTAYLKQVHDATVDAIVEAWRSAQPAVLTYGVAHAGVNGEAEYPPSDPKGREDWLLSNQFSYDPNNKAMDDEIRVLQARDPETDEVLDTYVNYSAHPTVLGDQKKVTGDYVGRLNLQIEQAYGGFAMDQVATLGRTQPADRPCQNVTAGMSDEDKDLCALDEYAARVLVKVKQAVDKAKPFTGKPTVAMNSYFLSDTTTSPVLAGIVYAGTALGIPAARAGNAPWYTGNQLGTTYFTGRIGSVLITGGPGEMYPQIPLKVRELVKADTERGITGYMNIGTAGDFLGYIIAPLEAYPEPIKRSFLEGDNTPGVVPNDNYFFNISHTFGERLTCDLLRGAGDILTDDPSTYWSQYDRCNAFVNDYVLPPGQDTQFPPQPDLSGVPGFDHI